MSTHTVIEERKLATPIRKIYSYYVVGLGIFPVDMLRYDRAWPARGDDVANIEKIGDRRFIKLNSYQKPTTARWNSFFWGVYGESDIPQAGDLQ